MMKFEKKLFKISLVETLSYLGLTLVLINGTVFAFTWINGNPRLLIYNSSWILQFVFPFFYSIIQTSVNRNGVLKLTMFDDSMTLTKKIESFILGKGYVAVGSENEAVKYIKKSKLGRFFNYFFREDVKVRVADNEIAIFAKRSLLDTIGMKLKFDRAD